MNIKTQDVMATHYKVSHTDRQDRFYLMEMTMASVIEPVF